MVKPLLNPLHRPPRICCWRAGGSALGIAELLELPPLLAVVGGVAPPCPQAFADLCLAGQPSSTYREALALTGNAAEQAFLTDRLRCAQATA
jgi:hypothetical protein